MKASGVKGVEDFFGIEGLGLSVALSCALKNAEGI